jgi:hypothetical protein
VSTTHQPAEPTRYATDDQPAQRPLRYRGHRLDGAVEQFRSAVDALERDTVPYAYYLKVLAGRDHPAAEPTSPERTHSGGER